MYESVKALITRSTQSLIKGLVKGFRLLAVFASEASVPLIPICVNHGLVQCLSKGTLVVCRVDDCKDLKD